MVRVLPSHPSHHCELGSNLGPGITCGFSSLLVLVLAPRGFLWVFQFSSLSEIPSFQMPIRPGKSGQEESPHGLSTAKIQLFIFLCTAIHAGFAMFGTSHYILPREG